MAQRSRRQRGDSRGSRRRSSSGRSATAIRLARCRPTASPSRTAKAASCASGRSPVDAIVRWLRSLGRFVTWRGGPTARPSSPTATRHEMAGCSTISTPVPTAAVRGSYGAERATASGEARRHPIRELRQPAWSPDGKSVAALVDGSEGNELWIVSSPMASSRATRLTRRASFPAWTSRGEVACVSSVDGRRRVTIPCDGPAIVPDPDRDAYGPIAFAPEARRSMSGWPMRKGRWTLGRAGRRWPRDVSSARLLATAMPPTVASDGRVLFKVQSYRTHVAMAAADGGPTRLADDVSKRNTVMGPDAAGGSASPTAHGVAWSTTPTTPTSRRRPALSTSAPAQPAVDGRPRRRCFRFRGSVALLVAQRQVDRLSLP